MSTEVNRGEQPLDYRLLIVEDNVDTAQALSRLLGSAFLVDVTNTKAEGLRRLSEDPPVHVVLLDLWLPNGAGMAVLRSFTSWFPHVPVVVITGHNCTREEALAAGASAFVPKPIEDIAELRAALARVTARDQVEKMFAREATPVSG